MNYLELANAFITLHEMQIYWHKCINKTTLMARAQYMQIFSQSKKRHSLGQTLHISCQKFVSWTLNSLELSCSVKRKLLRHLLSPHCCFVKRLLHAPLVLIWVLILCLCEKTQEDLWQHTCQNMRKLPWQECACCSFLYSWLFRVKLKKLRRTLRMVDRPVKRTN